MKKETIKICSCHQDKEETPLIYTFAFCGAEYWCPSCGATYGMLGAGDNVEMTFELDKRLADYKMKAKKFLRAHSLMACAYFEYKGERKKFREMSQRFQTYWINRSKEWKYKY